jgi:predicted anti-sigma-YlaC factor YlaD
VNCKSAERAFEAFLDGTLAARERAALLTHVDACDPCRGLLEELRVVDALLLTPREIRLAENFTFATMAEIRAQPRPQRPRSHAGAYAIAYLVAAWMLIGAIALLAPETMHVLGASTVAFARTVVEAFGGAGGALGSLFGHSPAGVAIAAALALAGEIVLAAGIGGAIRYVRPRLAERLRS